MAIQRLNVVGVDVTLEDSEVDTSRTQVDIWRKLTRITDILIIITHYFRLKTSIRLIIVGTRHSFVTISVMCRGEMRILIFNSQSQGSTRAD